MWLERSKISVDPFSRNKRWATYTNDINPHTEAEYHMDARDFLKYLKEKGAQCDLMILDPPYSPRQISECYKEAGIKATQADTQNSVLYKQVRDLADQLVAVGGVCLSFGWNSVGMGKGREYEIEEILMVCHGGAHNDTICIAERKVR